jgi:adenine-specific DNA-methyltransferase
MYPRLLLARDLLREDGVIFISIDDNEQAQLKLLCDEVFGAENFVTTITTQVNKGGRDYLPIAVTHES